MSRILIVDDSKALLELFSLILQGKGYHVQVAFDAGIMKELVADFNPDIILLDVRLGAKDGRKICSDIKQNEETKHIPIILLSASPELLIDYADCMADDCIEKPFDIDTVTQKIMKLLPVSRLVSSKSN